MRTPGKAAIQGDRPLEELTLRYLALRPQPLACVWFKLLPCLCALLGQPELMTRGFWNWVQLRGQVGTKVTLHPETCL